MLLNTASTAAVAKTRWCSTAKEIKDILDFIIRQHARACDHIVANAKPAASSPQQQQPRAYLQLARADSEAALLSTRCTLAALVASADEEARKASTRAKQQLKNMWTAAYSREDLYAVLAAER